MQREYAHLASSYASRSAARCGFRPGIGQRSGRTHRRVSRKVMRPSWTAKLILVRFRPEQPLLTGQRRTNRGLPDTKYKRERICWGATRLASMTNFDHILNWTLKRG